MGTILSDLNFTQGLKHSTSSQAINAKPMDTISARMFQQNQTTLNTVIKVESLYQLMYLQIYMLISYTYLQYYADIYHHS